MALSKKAQDQYKMDLYAKSLDTIRVKNPTDKDFILWFNKSGADNIPPKKEIIPAKTKDIGFGKGMIDLPRYLANRYMEKMIVQIINEKHEDEWQKMKKKYKPEEHERIEQRFAPKTNDEKLIEKIMPTVIVGLVKKYEIPVDTELEENKAAAISGDNRFDRVANKLELTNTLIQQKEDFLDAIQD